ncbi:MAG TPA: TonB-dependent receptor [Blastocatellia bacterium]|jgi:outer membrane receptor protein involved in Fe transport|nr:TonB-dependent receptor [Blastocatellia bacterium]
MKEYCEVFTRRLLSLLVATFLLSSQVFTQVSTGDITGRVLDPQGNVVPGATVTAKNNATGLTRTTTSNDSGEYTITQLPPGTYEITVEARGFSRALQKDFELNVGTKPTLNFDLRAGGVTETVEVQGSAPLIETTRSELGGVVSPTEVQNLPLLNRTFANLSTILPEARPVGSFDPTKTRVGNIAFSGGDGRQLDVNVDGGDDKDNVVGSLLQNFAFESIQEFQVLQHRWTAESGRAVGGVVNVVSKSGSNDLHGSGFFNYRNQDMRKLDFFEKRDKEERDRTGQQLPAGLSDKPDFNRQEFGGSLGGPIIKDKLFFFGAYEQFRERQSLFIPADLVTQIAAIPGTTASPTIPTPYNDHLLTAKIDQRIGSKQSMFYRYAYQSNDSPNDQVLPSLPSDLTGGNTNNNHLHSFVLNHTYTISPTKLNVFTFHFQNFVNEILGVTDNPNLTFPSVQSGANINVPQRTAIRKYQFRDDFAFQLGPHSLKAGTNYINTDIGGFFFFGANGYQIIFFDDPLTILSDRSTYPQGFATRGAVQEITFATGNGSTKQPRVHQLAFYVQDDYKVSPRLTLNLGLRWDANIHLLVDQTNNRTMRILQQLNDERAQMIAGDADKLRRTTPSFKEFQPRLGFAYDPTGDGRMVIRGGYGIFYDQIFQNLTLFSTQQTNPTIYQTVLDLVNSQVGVGDLANFRFGVDPLPAPPGNASNTDLEFGGFGRINDPGMRDPYVQKFSIGVQKTIGQSYVLSSDYVHTLGIHENRVQNINPQIRSICDPAFPGSTPNSSRCVRGASTRFFDRAFVDAGLGAGRLNQINMFTATNRSMFDSWTASLQGRARGTVFKISYVLSSSRAWGGQPTASYGGNGLAVTPEQQFRPEEFGPTRIDERHRFVASGVFDLLWGIQLSPIIQLASSRPYSLNTGFDVDGDGRSTVDRICEGTDPAAVFAARGNSAVLRALNPPGCTQVKVNSVRKGFIVDENGQIADTRTGRYFNVDLRATRVFSIGERFKIKPYAEFYNLFNTENLAFADRLGLNVATSASTFRQPVTLYGPGFGPPVARPLTLQLGFRVDF